MTALPPWARGALPLDLLFANANLPLWDRRLALERFGQFTVLVVVSIGGLQICGGRLLAQGDIKQWRYSEVRKPNHVFQS
jgi:hypothetical protein